MKTVLAMQAEMSELYDQVKKDEIEIPKADTLANIAGKFFKAEQLILARQVFEHGLAGGSDNPNLPTPSASRLLDDKRDAQ